MPHAIAEDGTSIAFQSARWHAYFEEFRMVAGPLVLEFLEAVQMK